MGCHYFLLSVYFSDSAGALNLALSTPSSHLFLVLLVSVERKIHSTFLQVRVYTHTLITSVGFWKPKCQGLWEGPEPCVHGLVCVLLNLWKQDSLSAIGESFCCPFSDPLCHPFLVRCHGMAAVSFGMWLRGSWVGIYLVWVNVIDLCGPSHPWE